MLNTQSKTSGVRMRTGIIQRLLVCENPTIYKPTAAYISGGWAAHLNHPQFGFCVTQVCTGLTAAHSNSPMIAMWLLVALAKARPMQTDLCGPGFLYRYKYAHAVFSGVNPKYRCAPLTTVVSKLIEGAPRVPTEQMYNELRAIGAVPQGANYIEGWFEGGLWETLHQTSLPPMLNTQPRMETHAHH